MPALRGVLETALYADGLERRPLLRRRSESQDVAFAIDAADLAAWEERLSRAGVAIEGGTAWPRSGQSLYVRDPDGHLIEFATPGLWATY